MQPKLYVGNLAYSTTEADLRTLFSQAGGVTAVDLILDRDSGQSKGFAFVTMTSLADAQNAIGMLNAFTIHEREMTVSLAKAKEERPGGPGGRPGGLGVPRQRAHKPRGGNRRY
jgi:RNA recognition motif-containing protein